jgi:hypothetical protein
VAPRRLSRKKTSWVLAHHLAYICIIKAGVEQLFDVIDTNPQDLADPAVGLAPSGAPSRFEATRLDPPHAALDGPFDPLLPGVGD